jgi:GTP pyrophosphokinase
MTARVSCRFAFKKGGEYMYCKNAQEVNKLYDDLINVSFSDSELSNENNTISFLIELFESYSKDFHASEEIVDAYEFAKSMHDEEKRESGEKYITHPLAVAIILAYLHADKNTIIAGILHDIVENTPVTAYTLGQRYNQEVMNYVIGVSKKGDIGNELIKLNDSEYNRQLLTKGAKELVILIIKIADRLHNMRTLHFKKDREKRIENALETLNSYAPLAGSLGLYTIKNELEDLALKNISLDAYEIIDKKVKEVIEQRKTSVLNTIKFIDDLSKYGDQFEYELKFAKKNIYSIYKQCFNPITKELTGLDKLHDLISVQIIVDDVAKCREVNNLITSAYRVNNAETKDYIANPKANMYRSLHTTIFDDNNNILQFQIRTPEMDKIANFGYAAYWDLKGHSAKKDMYEDSKRNLFKPIHAIDRLSRKADDFMELFQDEIFAEDKITVYTPKGDPIELPAGSTVIDFAYRIHSEIGNCLDFAIISNYNTYLCNKPYEERTAEEKLDSIFHPLEDGDRVLLVKSEKVEVNTSWLNNIKTNRARKKINECLKNKNSSKINDLSISANMQEESKRKELHM